MGRKAGVCVLESQLNLQALECCHPGVFFTDTLVLYYTPTCEQGMSQPHLVYSYPPQKKTAPCVRAPILHGRKEASPLKWSHSKPQQGQHQNPVNIPESHVLNCCWQEDSETRSPVSDCASSPDFTAHQNHEILPNIAHGTNHLKLNKVFPLYC